jgi:hypothetical protein
MGQIVIKPDFDVDFYAVWDHIMDDFLAGGSRAAWENGPDWYNVTPDRLDRADEFGTSEIPSERRERWYGWDCEQFLLHRADGVWWLQRRDIPEYLSRKSRGESVAGLLEPVENDDEPVQSLTMEELQAKWKKERDSC